MGKEYNEVLEILKHIPKEDFEKIPKEMIEMFEKNVDKNFVFNYNVSKTLDEQNVSKEAKTIIAILFKRFWATEQQKEKLKKAEDAYKNKLEEEKRKKYNPDNIFNNKKETDN